jgi:hypothetical protein
MHLLSLRSISALKADVCEVPEISVTSYGKGGPAFRRRGVGVHVVAMMVSKTGVSDRGIKLQDHLTQI